ncbi:MAG TPA: hypothetical protein DEO82_02510 [Eubacterium sp.]|nr:hypothetical protein [Eubacterium sp.]
MQVFRSFFRVAKSNKSGLIMYTCIVIGMIIALSANNKGKNTENAAASCYTVYVVDEDNSVESKALVAYIGKLHDVSKEKLTDEMITESIYYQHIACCIRIPEGFGDSLSTDTPSSIVCEYDEALPNGIFVNMQLNRLLGNAVKRYLSGESFDDSLENSYKAMDMKEYVSIRAEEVKKESITPVLFTFLPFGIFSIIFSTILPTVLLFNKKEIKDRTEASSLKLLDRNIAIISGVGVFCLIILAVLITAATIPEAGEYFMTKKWLLAVLALSVYTLACIMLLSFIVNFELKDGAVAAITNIIGLSFAFLGGTFVGVDLLGDKIKAVGRFTPNYWYTLAVKDIFRGESVGVVMGKIGVIFAFALACFGVSMMTSRVKR